jgi:hypothetical protein
MAGLKSCIFYAITLRLNSLIKLQKAYERSNNLTFFFFFFYTKIKTICISEMGAICISPQDFSHINVLPVLLNSSFYIDIYLSTL